MVSRQSVWNPVLTSWPPSSQRSSTDHWNCAKYTQETQNYRNKWLQAGGSNVCGHEVIWKTGAGPPEGHHWTLARSSSVCLQSKQVCGRCSQHGTALCSATSRQTRGLCEDPICGLQLGLYQYHPKPPPAQTNSALRAHLHLSWDQQLPDRQAAASEAGKIHIQHPYEQHWGSSGLWSLPTTLLPVHKLLHI